MTKKTITFFLSFFFLFLYGAGTLSAQIVSSKRLMSFEDVKQDGIVATNSTIERSYDHYKDGKASLKWNYRKGATLSVKRPLHYEYREKGDRDLYLSTFIVWIYREKPTADSLRFTFLKDGRECCGFAMGQNYTGWRTAWVCYQRDMQGIPEEGMNEVKITAPSSESKGVVYIDHLLTAVKTDPRHQSADRQVPFVNRANDNHWLVALKKADIQPDTVITKLSMQTIREFATIETRLKGIILNPVKADEKLLEKLRHEYDKYLIERGKGHISGKPIFFARAREAYERLDEVPAWRDIFERNGMEARAYFALMKRIAIAWHNADGDIKEELGDMFMNMYDHVTDQGFACGSCLGNITHYGYSFRDMYPAYFLMKEEFKRRGKLDEASATLRWYAMTNEVFLAPQGPGIDVDALNTKVTGTLASILLMANSPEKEAYLRRFARMLDVGCRPSPGLSGGFKVDGAAFHHRNNYPAYATGGLTGAVNMAYALHGTSFALGKEAHGAIREALLTMRFYCNKTYYPLSLSGRHPDGKGTIHPYQFAKLALAGTPDGSCELDTLMASAFLRLIKDPKDKLTPEEKAYAKSFKSKGITPERDPRGQKTIAYGSTSIHRRATWAAVVRGHSRYLWASEHYEQDNFYGRYLANGSLQILYSPQGTPGLDASAGWKEKGFNWNRIPGATGVTIPLEAEEGPSLRARIYNVDKYSGREEMLLSDQTFAGGLDTPEGNGVYGMILHGHDKYDGTLWARKSYHFLNGKIVCLGSGICDEDVSHSTETTIYQLTGDDYYGENLVSEAVEGGIVVTDHLGTKYYIPEGQNLVYEYNENQVSRNEGNGKVETGKWATLYFSHGEAPTDARYEYVVLPKGGPGTLNYKVLQADKKAHVVQDEALGIVSYSIFEEAPFLAEGPVASADTALLASCRTNTSGEVLFLTVANPDLAFYSGPSDEKFDENGKRIERSVYSRSWIDNPSQEVPTALTIRGVWTITEGEGAEIVYQNPAETKILFHCKDGASLTIRLKKQ